MKILLKDNDGDFEKHVIHHDLRLKRPYKFPYIDCDGDMWISETEYIYEYKNVPGVVPSDEERKLYKLLKKLKKL